MQENNLSSLIFMPTRPLPEFLGQPREREEIIQQIYGDAETLLEYNTLNLQAQEALLDFCMGNRNLKITYDPFFRNIFHPFKHPARLNRFLSAILEQSVTVRDILPREGARLSAESSLMVMDILVELSDGTLVNVEMQKIGYDFPIERTFCYGADLLVRQYDRLRDVLKEKFTYRCMRPVYIIVLMESSPSGFLKYPDTYIHHSRFQLDSGLSIGNLLNFIYISLDIFLKMPHNELTELEAWLYFLGSDNPLHIRRITEKYPFFNELYKDIIHFRYHPKELIHMFSEALLIADRNTVHLMIDELKQEIADKDAEIADKDAEISSKDVTINEQADTIASLKKRLAANGISVD